MAVYNETNVPQNLKTGDIVVYNFTGNVRELSLLPGKYILKAWGAEGGRGLRSATIRNGGKGGYSVGTISLDKLTKAFIRVGGKGTDYG